MIDFPMDEALNLIAACKTDAELNDVKSILLGKDSILKQMEKALWDKPIAPRTTLETQQ